MHTDLAAVQQAINATTLSPDAKRICGWSMEQLPRLYGQLLQAYDSRFADEILCRVQTLLKALDEKPEVAREVCAQFVTAHERLGLPKLAFKTSAVKAKSTRSRKVA